jgi:hypothetical protein
MKERFDGDLTLSDSDLYMTTQGQPPNTGVIMKRRVKRAPRRVKHIYYLLLFSKLTSSLSLHEYDGREWWRGPSYG